MSYRTEILQWVQTTLKADSTLQGLLGAAGRIFGEWPRVEIPITVALPGYVVCWPLATGAENLSRAHGQEREVPISVDVFSLSRSTFDSIKDRIDVLLRVAISTANYRAATVLEDGCNPDLPETTAATHHGNVTYRVMNIFKTSGTI